MNKRLSNLSFIFFLLLGFVALAYSATQAEGSVGQYVDSASITAKVKTALLQTSGINATDISVKTYNGIVQLSGFVGSQAEARLAEKVAANVAQVQTVKNNLIVKQGSESASAYMASSMTTAKVKSALLGTRGLNSSDINVETYKGMVQLSGFVDSEAQAQLAETVAAGVTDVKSVQNDLIIK